VAAGISVGPQHGEGLVRLPGINVHESYDVDQIRRGWGRCRGLRTENGSRDERNRDGQQAQFVNRA
jgi:hypothetical protein